MLDRRRFIKTSAAATTAASLGFPAIVRGQTRDQVSLMTPFGFIPDFIEMMNAVSGGHFAAQNLDAKIIGGQGGAQAMQQLVAGQVDILRAASLDVMLAKGQTNVPLVSIATIYQGGTFHMISPKSKPIEKAEDLKGKTVGLVTRGGTSDILLDLVLAKAGLKPDDVKREATGNSPGAMQFVKQGRVDCFFGSLLVVIALQNMKEEILAWSIDRYAPMPGQTYVVTQQTAEKKGAILTRAVRALHASAVEMVDKPLKPIFERAAKDFEIPGMRDLDSVVAQEKATIDQLWLSEGRENLMRNVPKLWQAGVSALRENKIGNPGEAETLYTNKFLDAK
ncbi:MULTISPECIES: ABC transporter substrate-binding protein [unclassified Beijerinckia]|uniref:ABC transporter substrate-binding protein n=1 Tax=unclassified Beijerinckia TaxID=2638183 RepID=UPI000895F10E|nr:MULTISPECIES: ABC transporter substrate-binding protein [unclassified Beijerinckia]MDH7797613.1 NitT/TauT family transport system substrate-binding protein [Beijerinckia sp. GAS462]SEC92353.1 Tat (twin-arginine translocation) pathway signal sequence [Beijerinckia sp. 28-YEA-48]